MADEARHAFHHDEDGVQADRNGEGRAVADLMVVMPVAVSMPMVVSMMMAVMPVVMAAMIVAMVMIVLQRGVGGVGVASVGGIMSHEGSFRRCCVAQMSHCSKIRER